MSGSPQRYVEGDHLRITEANGTPRLWVVRKRAGRGWRLEPVGGGDTRTLADGDITRMRRQIEHYPQGRAGLTAAQEELLERAFESNKAEACVEAMRRAEYLWHAHRLHKEGVPLDKAFERASSEVFAEKGAVWQQEDEAAAEAREATRAERRRVPPEMLKSPPKPPKPLAAPRPSTIESWYHPWVMVGHDIRILIPLIEKRGNRTSRFKGESACIPERMKFYIETKYLDKRRASLNEVHKLLNKELGLKGLKVSYKCFSAHLEKNYSEHEEVKRRFNWRRAHLETGVFKRKRPPAKPLDEIEVDHSLLDIIVVNETSGRPLGRPWITLALDRCTRMVLGVHVSFEPPSFASLQRCLAHAFWPKDLTGLGLRNPWPTEGIPRLVFCDNGKEFHSRSLKLAELSMGFTVVNLPPRQPWLKGKVERIFGRIGIQVFDLVEGKTFSNPAKRYEYNSVATAKMNLAELKEKLLRYFIDDYHVNFHDGLKGVPLEEWQRHAEVDRIEGVRSFEDIRRLMGAAFLKPITNVGIKLFGLVYYHDDLKALRRRRGGTTKRFHVRADPFDLGEVEVLDEETGRWLVVPCDRPELAAGVSLHQARTNDKRARRLAEGGPVTDLHRIEGRRLEAEEVATALGDTEAKTTAARAARYGLDNGRFFTPLVGQPTPANDPAPVPAEGEAAAGEGTGDQAGSTEPSAGADPDVQAAMLAMMAQWTRRSA
ncbi:integrase catalytic domain-containing protein [Methylobacterium sp. JK268]